LKRRLDDEAPSPGVNKKNTSYGWNQGAINKKNVTAKADQWQVIELQLERG
jgi:hypothetical protein